MKNKKGFFTGFRRAGTSSESARERPLGIDMVDFAWSLSEDDFISETDGTWSSGSSSQEVIEQAYEVLLPGVPLERKEL